MNTRLLSVILAIAATFTLGGARADVPQPAQLTAADVTAFFDGMLPTYMASGDIAGATLAIVKDDALLLSKAYGYADVEKRQPVSAEQTLFRPASISKLFTWTAVMQQVEAGRLDLDHDINEYLDFKIEGYGGQPIKLRHLMTHTAGFEETLLDLLIDDPSRIKPLQQVLKEGMPASIYPPGAVPAYSNYGATLAGYIVTRVSGMPFEQYVEQHIFQPLKMQHSTFRQPVPDPLRQHVSKGYAAASGPTVPFEYGSDVPAGALSATGPDLAQFMMAHLNDGLLPGGDESNRILKPQTTQLMHSVANRPAAGVDAMAHGFYEQNRNGVRVIAHGGDLIAFHSELLLIPAAKVGLFVSFNSSGKDGSVYKLRTALFESFMDRYFPRQQAAEASPPASPQAQQHADSVAGSYQFSRRAESSLFSFFYLFGQQSASAADDGTFELGGLTALNGQPKKFHEVGPWLWQEAAGETRVAAVRDDSGAVVSLVPDGYGPIFIFQRTPLWRDKTWLQPALMVAGSIVVIALLARLIGFIRRRFFRSGATTAEAAVNDRARRLSLAAILSCSLFVGLTVAVLLMFSSASFWVISSEARWFLRLVQLSALLAVLGAIVAVVVAVGTWRSPARRLSLSLGRTALAGACLVWAYVAVAFHFLAVRLHY